MLSWKSGLGAWFTANGHKSLKMQLVVWDLFLTDQLPNFSRGNIGEWVPLDQISTLHSLESAINVDQRHSSTGGALILTLSSDPTSQTAQLTLERANLSDIAAFLVSVLHEAEQTLCSDQVLGGFLFREGVLNIDTVVISNSLHVSVGLSVKTTSIEREYTEGKTGFGSQVDEDHILSTRKGDGNVVAMGFQSCGHDFLWAGCCQRG
mmetsp:Transcript_149064/g.211819  ORF Transcript_149064/g.211819 Transcript_149064/m.211819 type:complete len:207 (+) Transcript_149064:359-979(+)